jgi:sigma-B regulation protein RsbU (phosphoserine phosphatase)
MVARDYKAMQKELSAKRQTIAGWLNSTPVKRRKARLGAAPDDAVRAHLQVIDETIQKTQEETFGVCKVCHGTIEPYLMEMDYTSDVCLGDWSDEELRQLEVDLKLSQTVQKALLPQQVPSIPGLDLAVFSRPAQILGGDYFDFVKYRDGATGLAIADAMGHGMSAGLIMASVQAALSAFVPESYSPDEVIRRMNRFFLHNIHLTTFVTLILARFEPGDHTLVYANAGHNPPIHTRKVDGRSLATSWLMPTGAAIGLVEEYHVSSDKLDLTPGDTLLFYTDGLTEAVNERIEEFGDERLEKLVTLNHDLPAKDLVWALRQTLQEYTGGRPLADDTTIVACKIL